MSRAPRRTTALRAWLHEKKGRGLWLRQKLCCSADTVENLSTGRVVPSLERAFLIERFTEGRVPAVSWLDEDRMRIAIRGIKPDAEGRNSHAKKAA